MKNDVPELEPGQFVRLGRGCLKGLPENRPHRMRARVVEVARKKMLVQIPGHKRLEWVNKKGARVWKAKNEEAKQIRQKRKK